MSGSVLFLTGVTGLVGSELLQALLDARPDRRVIALTRHPDQIASLSRSGRVTAIEGDLTRSGLGLRSGTLRQIQKEVTEVIHCAAETRFGLPIEEARATNTRGTANVLKIAQACKRLKKFAHLSTVYVAGRMTGHIPEAAFHNDSGFVSTYQQSKYEAEQLVFEAMTEIPAVIYRLSTIIGDSKTGRVRQYNYFHQTMRLFARNVLPVAPGNLSWQIDLISTDWLTAALAFLFESRFVPGQVLNVCAGASGSPIMMEVKDTSIGLFEKHPLIQKWLPIRVPEFVILSEYEKYVQESQQSGDYLLIEVLKVLNNFLPQMGINQCFDNQQLISNLEGSGISLPSFTSYFSKVVNYCLETDWGRKGDKPLSGQR
jgi:nucleoside-diphosphate-sugar epimerase